MSEEMEGTVGKPYLGCVGTAFVVFVAVDVAAVLSWVGALLGRLLQSRCEVGERAG
jgi:hypothetical protein